MARLAAKENLAKEKGEQWEPPNQEAPPHFHKHGARAIFYCVSFAGLFFQACLVPDLTLLNVGGSTVWTVEGLLTKSQNLAVSNLMFARLRHQEMRTVCMDEA